MTKFMGSDDPLALIGVCFDAYKDAVQHYSGRAVVMRLKKNGLYECHGVNLESFEETKTKILRGLNNG